MPIANALCFPSAKIATTEPLSRGVINAPGDVNPGHIIFAPLRTNRMAPLSTCSIGTKNGNLWNNLSVGIHGPSRWRKNSWSPAPFTKISMWSWQRIILKASFFGRITSMDFSICGNCSSNFVRIFFWTEDFNCCVPETLSLSSNLRIGFYGNFYQHKMNRRKTYFLNIFVNNFDEIQLFFNQKITNRQWTIGSVFKCFLFKSMFKVPAFVNKTNSILFSIKREHFRINFEVSEFDSIFAQVCEMQIGK